MSNTNTEKFMYHDEEIHIRDYLEVIKNRKWVVLSFLFITVFVVAIFTFTATPIYEASTEILVEQNQPALSTGRLLLPTYDPEFFETQARLISSKNVALKVVNLLNLDQTYESYFPKKDDVNLIKIIATPIRDFISGFRGEPEETLTEEQKLQARKERMANMIIQNLEVKPVQDSHVITVSFQSTNPEFAALVVNTIAKAYQAEMMDIHMNVVGYAIKWMTKKADEIKRKLAESEQALQEFMRKNNIVTIKDRVMIQPQKLADLSAKLSKAIAERKEVEATYNKVMALQEAGGNLETIPDIAVNANIKAINNEILKSEQQVAQLSQKYGPKHPVMKKALSDLRALKRKKRKELQIIVALIQNQYELAKMKEENLTRALEEAKAEVQDLNQKFIQYGILKREVDTSQALYDALVISMKEKGITEESQRVNVWVINQAEVPKKPVKPKKIRNMLLAVVLGIFGGVGMAFLLEYMDNTITDPDTVERRLGLVTLGVIERLESDSPKDIYQGLINHGRSAFAEGFRAVRAALLLASADEPPKSVLITSMNPEEGKTTVAANIALALAIAGHKVLLVDADLRKPMLHKAFDLDNDRGLSSFLAGVDSKPGIIKEPSHEVYMLPAGPMPPNPAELLSSDRMKALLKQAQEKFEIVIVDTSPLLSASDGLVLSRLVSGTIIVGMAGQTTFDDLSRGLDQLKKLNPNILGMVVNGVDAKKHHYYYSYYKGYYAYHDNDSKG